jgi:allophanate hydrolase subunit 1
MFRADRPGMCLLAIGDQVRFAPISPERFAALESA